MKDERLGKEGFEILIVEDSPTQAEELTHTLKRQGFAVRSAGNGVLALAMIREKRPTIVISDIVMPEMDGYRLCREIKDDGALGDIPVILLTALSDPSDVVKGLECGADNFITKPYDERYILSRIQYILANMHLKDVEKTQLGVEIILAGERYFIKSDRIQILNLLLSSYEAAVRKNEELAGARDELRALGDQLEHKVKERTAALSEEVIARRKAEEALIEAKEEWERTFDAITDPVMVLGVDYRIVKVNKAMADKLGRSPADVVGLRCFEAVHGCKEPPSHCPHSLLLADGSPHSAEIHEERLGGDFLVAVSPLRSAGGKLVGSVHYARDITAVKDAQRSLHDEQKRFRDVLDRLPAYLLLLTPDYRVPFANRFFEERFGKSGGRLCYEYLFNRTEPCESCETYTVLKINAPHRWEWRGPDGRDYDIHDFPFTDADGSPLIMNVGFDITERKRAETSLRESEEKFRSLSETAADAITMIDNEGDIAYWNPAAERILGYTKNEVMGKSLHLLLAPERYHDLYRKGFARYRETGSGPAIGKTLEFEAVKKDGAEIPVEVSFSVMHINNERFAIGVIRDISERKRAERERLRLEEQLRLAQKMEAIGQLSGGIAHDFNNILMAIIGFSNILKMKLDARDPMQADIDQILAASDRAAHLTQSMLAYSRKQIMAPKTVDLNEIVRNGEKFLRRVIGEDVEFLTRLSNEPLHVFADCMQIEQVLMNLVTNARDAMPDGGTLSVTTDFFEIDDRFIGLYDFAKKGEYALLTLSDTGAGMDEATARRIFEPFFTTKDVGHGTGLGLSVVYGIIKQHDGFITCYSEPGKGTTFRIYLPLFHGEMEKGVLIPEICLPEGKETILLAEDDPTSRGVSKRYLENFGYTVIEATDGVEAVEKFMEHIDVIELTLLDVIMPRMNGREVYNRIREIKPDAKVIFMSGYTADIIHKEEIVGEGLKVLTKPGMLKELLVTIREELGA